VREQLIAGYLPVIIFLIVVVALGLVLMVVSQLLGRKNPNPEKNSTYECGMIPIKDARQRFDVRFYLIAMFFILFDIEAVFLIPWAIVFNKFNPVIFGFIEMVVFMVILLFGYLYIWRKGALDWR